MSEAGKLILETERFVLREHTVADAQAMYELNLDPEVVRYIGDKPFESVEAMRQFIERYEDYKKYGMGRWAIFSKQDGSYMGWCGLKHLRESGQVDLGYRLPKRNWGKGIATETGRASLHHGFTTLGLERIVAHAAVENAASIHVLKKLGMRQVGRGQESGLEVFGFEIERREFLGK
jgi:RimJ/RimL family protein N-acetyltransferase